VATASQDTRETTFSFRLDPALKAAFTEAAEADRMPAAEVLRRFMRAYVEQRQRSAFEAEAQRQSVAIAARARDPKSDEHEAIHELDTELDGDAFSAEWKANRVQ
jgi:predicted transcriptional regulator